MQCKIFIIIIFYALNQNSTFSSRIFHKFSILFVRFSQITFHIYLLIPSIPQIYPLLRFHQLMRRVEYSEQG